MISKLRSSSNSHDMQNDEEFNQDFIEYMMEKYGFEQSQFTGHCHTALFYMLAALLLPKLNFLSVSEALLWMVSIIFIGVATASYCKMKIIERDTFEYIKAQKTMASQ